MESNNKKIKEDFLVKSLVLFKKTDVFLEISMIIVAIFVLISSGVYYYNKEELWAINLFWFFGGCLITIIATRQILFNLKNKIVCFL